MDFYPCGSRPSRRGPAESFTGVVWQDPIIEAPAPARVRSGLVRFEPGARTHWHAHPVGQVLYCLSGVGRICIGKGSQPQPIYPGDTVMIPPNAMHWHGAAPDRLFAHLAMSELGEAGQGTQWGEPVSDTDYRRAVAV